MANVNVRAVLVLAVAIIVAALLLGGGPYSTTPLATGYVRTNRLTGSILRCAGFATGAETCVYVEPSSR